MRQINISEAKTHLSRLIEDATGGENIMIARAGKPMAVLTRLIPTQLARQPGLLEGTIWIADDFDGPLPEVVLKAFGCPGQYEPLLLLTHDRALAAYGEYVWSV